MKKQDPIQKIFEQYPDAKEVFKAPNGTYWLSKESAQAQGKGKVETIKRTK